MKTVLVTGASGFIGRNLCAQLALDKDTVVQKFTKDNTLDELAGLVKAADFVFHIAGVNRPQNEADFETGNRDLTENIVNLLKEVGKKTPVLLTSSTQAALENSYGKSKLSAEQLVFNYENETGAATYVYRLPNVFGKWSRPNYNSVVATFCSNIANDRAININDPSAELNLVYIDDVVESFITTMRELPKLTEGEFVTIEKTFSISLGDLADKLQAYRQSRDSLLMPNLEDEFDHDLYATYISFLEEDNFAYPLEMKRDERGWLAEFVKSKQFGMVFISRSKPGISRGNHWHHTKIEKFLVIDGDGEIKFRNLNTTKVITYKVSGDELKVVDIPAGYIHSITNTGSRDLTTVFWAHEIFNPEKPDTYYEEV